jgi:predicted DNA-binding transcriptional regulator AlpA
MSTDRLIDKREVMSRLDIKARQTLANWEDAGYLTPVRLGRTLRFRESDVDRIVREGIPRKPKES